MSNPSFRRLLILPCLFLGCGFLMPSVRGAAGSPPETPAPKPEPPPISFSIQYMVSGIEGPEIKRPYFAKGTTKIVFREIDKCRFYGAGSRFSLIPEAFSGAEVLLVHSGFKPENPFAGEDLVAYRDEAERLIPAGASGLQFEPQPSENPFALNGWSGRQFRFRYSVGGRPVVRVVVFLNLDSFEQLVVSITAAEENFEETMRLARKFFNFWHFIEDPAAREPILN